MDVAGSSSSSASSKRGRKLRQCSGENGLRLHLVSFDLSYSNCCFCSGQVIRPRASLPRPLPRVISIPTDLIIKAKVAEDVVNDKNSLDSSLLPLPTKAVLMKGSTRVLFCLTG